MLELKEYEEFTHDVFVTACEGGINYWADVSNYYHKDSPHVDFHGWSAVLTVDDADGYGINDSLSIYTLNQQTIESGIYRLIHHFKTSQPESYSDPFLQSDVDRIGFALYKADRANDYGAVRNVHDVEWADIIVQYGLFGELVYN
jgi:hypothetical protein